MKTITIGRDPQCNITINDEKISRRHAVLRIHTFGKMELVNMSSNGTWVNGVKLTSGTPFPVTRKNTVSFAKVRMLDWQEIPNPMKRFGIIVASVVAALILICGLIVWLNDESSYQYEVSGSGNSAVSESVGIPDGVEIPKATEPTKEQKDSKTKPWDELEKQRKHQQQNKKAKKEDNIKDNKKASEEESAKKTEESEELQQIF